MATTSCGGAGVQKTKETGSSVTNGTGWDAYRRLRAAGLPTTTRSVTKGTNTERWEAFSRVIAAGATTTKTAGEVNDTSEKAARAAYSKLSPRDKTDVDAWRDLGNSYFDSLLNSGVLTRTRTNPEDRTRMSSRGAKEVFHDLPWQTKDAIREWVATGHDLPDAIVNSNALGSGPPITPREARHEALRINRRREAAEHEASHAVAAHALGLDVRSASIADDNSGSCVHVQGTKLESAIVLMAPEIWIDRFRRDRFPYGPTGLKADHRALAEISDELILRRAVGHCIELLKQNRAATLTLADRLEKYGSVVAPW